MNKKEIEKQYKIKIKLFYNYNKYDYEKNKPLVTDKEYDELKKDILILEKKFNYLDSKYSPLKIVGFKPSKKQSD